MSVCFYFAILFGLKVERFAHDDDAGALVRVILKSHTDGVVLYNAQSDTALMVKLRVRNEAANTKCYAISSVSPSGLDR